MNTQPDPQFPVSAPAQSTGRRRRLRVTVAIVAGALAVTTLGGTALGVTTERTPHAATATAFAKSAGTADSGGSATAFGGGSDSSTVSGTGAVTRSAATTEEAGVVDITTVLDYGAGRAAGTGIVLTSSGEILTNNHVVDEATAVTVTVTATGARYSATVVGTDPTDDVAVLQISGASGLTTAPLATTAQEAGLAVGDAVTAVGNAGGTGGTPTAASGSVVALDQSITAGDDNGTNPERLTGLIEVDADVQAGDSGGPLETGGTVVGIDTAASAESGGDRSGDVGISTVDAATRGYAIPITTATAIAQRIVAGAASSTIHLGYPAFLGVQVSDGIQVTGVLSGSPAAAAGLAAGDTITAIDGTAVTDASTLSTALGAHRPHDRVRVTWTDDAGATHTATVTLAAGPAD